MAVDTTRTSPNTLTNVLPNADWGKSRVPFYEGEATTPRRRQIKLVRNKANKSFTLPANCRIHGDIVICNNSGSTQAAITIGTAAAGTQISAGASVATMTTAIQAATDSGISRTDRTIYVESAAWQNNVSIVLNVTEYPPVSDTTAKS